MLPKTPQSLTKPLVVFIEKLKSATANFVYIHIVRDDVKGSLTLCPSTRQWLPIAEVPLYANLLQGPINSARNASHA